MSDTDQEAVLATADQWTAFGRQIALVTLIEAWNGAPLPIGSQLLVDRAKNTIGSISDGLIEEPVIAEALKTIEDREPRLLNFDVSEEMAAEAKLKTGGSLRLFVEPIEGGE